MLKIRLNSFERCYYLMFIVFLLLLSGSCSQEQRKDISDTPVKGRVRTKSRRITVHFVKGYINEGPIRFPVLDNTVTGQSNDASPVFDEPNLPRLTDPIVNIEMKRTQTAEGKTINSDGVKKPPSMTDVKPSGIRERHIPIAKGYVDGGGSLSFPVFKDGKRIGIQRPDGTVVLFSNQDSSVS